MTGKTYFKCLSRILFGMSTLLSIGRTMKSSICSEIGKTGCHNYGELVLLSVLINWYKHTHTHTHTRINIRSLFYYIHVCFFLLYYTEREGG